MAHRRRGAGGRDSIKSRFSIKFSQNLDFPTKNMQIDFKTCVFFGRLRRRFFCFFRTLEKNVQKMFKKNVQNISKKSTQFLKKKIRLFCFFLKKNLRIDAKSLFDETFFVRKVDFSHCKFFISMIFFGILGFWAAYLGFQSIPIFGTTGFVLSSGVLNQFRSRKTPGIAHKAA